MKKIHLLFLVLIGILSSFLITGCKKKEDKKEPIYYYVTFDEANGKNPTMVQVEKGKTVSRPETDPKKDGFNFKFWSEDQETEFDFSSTIEKHTTLTAIYESVTVKTTRIIWNEDEAIEYIFENEVPRNIAVGTIVEFDVRVSPYYDGELEVFANNEKINQNANHHYSFTATDVSSINITVSGLTAQNAKIKGNGTKNSPFIIANASQFKTFTDGVNSSTDHKYNKSYISLENDIDFNGFTIDVIGDTLNINEFSGHFDGKNHTLSNFNIKDNNGLFGLFGYLVTAEVSNLTIDTNLSSVPNSDYYNLIGSLAAYNIASDIYNCHFNGSIDVKNEKGKAVEVYVGGLVGYMQSYSRTNTSILGYSTVNANITSTGSMEVTSMGGLVGLLSGTHVSVAAYIYNSAFNGNITGTSLASGGIAGTLKRNTSVTNCYSTGTVDATSIARKTAAGGIVGIAENESAVSYSFSTATITSSNPNNEEFIVGDIIGSAYPNAQKGIDDKKVLEVENYYSTTKKVEKDGVTYRLDNLSDIVKLLKWHQEDWQENLQPDYEKGEQSEFIVNFDFGKDVTNEGLDGSALTQKVDVITIAGYLPIYQIYEGNGMNTFVADDQTISFGFFLDAERTIRIPSSYLISKNETIYVGFADYKDIEGEYYVFLDNQEIKIVFDNNGKMTMYYDGAVENYMYVYNGNVITIKEAYFAHIEYPNFADAYDLDIDYYAEKEQENLIIYDSFFFAKENGMEITAHKANLAMGKWYTTTNLEYIFQSDGTGKISDGSTFAYTCIDRQINIIIGSKTINAIISEDGTSMSTSTGEELSITKYDEFMGTWETEFANQDLITFNGKGQVEYHNDTYDYIIKDEILTFANYRAYFNAQGLLILEKDNETKVFGRSGSYIGTWTDTLLDYWIVFEGINKDGYGYGYDSYGFDFTYVEEAEVSNSETIAIMTIYFGTQLYGYGSLATGDNGSRMLYLAVYTPSSGMIVDDYNACYIDSFFGDWNCENGMSVSFNGLGGYDIYEYLNTMQTYWDVRGFVTITENQKETKVRYYFDQSTRIGTFEYNGVTYQVTIEGDNLLINNFTFIHPDGLNDYDYQTERLVFQFNGKSNVNLGKVIIKSESAENDYDYVYENGIIEIYDGETKVYTINTNNDFELTDGQGNQEQLGLYHKIMGNKYAISDDSEIEFNQLFDINGAASAILKTADSEYELTVLYIDKSYVSLYLNQTFMYYAYYLDESAVALCNANFEPVSVIAKEDELRGTWTNLDGTTITFDGLSKASKYARAICEMVEQDEIGTYIEQYSYEKTDNGYKIIELETKEELYNVYTEYVENATEYKQGDKSIYLVKIN